MMDCWIRAGMRCSRGAILVGALVATGAVGLGPALAGDGTVVTVAPLSATVNAAALGAWPSGDATYVIRRYDDSRTHDTVERALEGALVRATPGGGRGAGPSLDLEFELYVIRSGVPMLAKGILETEDVRRRDRAGALPPGIDVTALRGRTAAVEGNVFHDRQDSFSSIMRFEVRVRGPVDGDVLWHGWVDTPLNGLSRAQAATLVADPLMETLGETVARRRVVVRVPESMGGAPPPDTPAIR